MTDKSGGFKIKIVCIRMKENIFEVFTKNHVKFNMYTIVLASERATTQIKDE